MASPLLMLLLLLLASASHPHAGARAEGQPCGVYTPACGRGLRCLPPGGEASPLRALLQGRGSCVGVELNTYGTTTAGSQARVTENLQKGPCHKLLMSALQKLDLTLIRPRPDLYIPNCERDGSFKRKQCLASHRMKRGECWCVDEEGHRTRGDAQLTCSSST